MTKAERIQAQINEVERAQREQWRLYGRFSDRLKTLWNRLCRELLHIEAQAQRALIRARRRTAPPFRINRGPIPVISAAKMTAADVRDYFRKLSHKVAYDWGILETEAAVLE